MIFCCLQLSVLIPLQDDIAASKKELIAAKKKMSLYMSDLGI